MALTASHIRTQLQKVRAFVSSASVPVVFGGETVQGLKTTIDITQETDDIGTWDAYDFSVLTSRGDWSTAPSSGDEVTVDGNTRQVIIAHQDSIEALLRLDLGEAYA